MKYVFDLMDQDGTRDGIKRMLRDSIRNAAYYEGDPKQGGLRVPRNDSTAYQQMVKLLEEVTGKPFVWVDDFERMKVARHDLYTKQLQDVIERRKWNSGLDTTQNDVEAFRQLWLGQELQNVNRWKEQNPADRPEVIIELDKYARHVIEELKSMKEVISTEVNKFCTAENFKKDLNELCPECPLRIEITNTIEKQIVFQAEQQSEILTDHQFEEYCNREIEDAQREMMKTNTLTLQDNDDKKFRVARIKVFIWNKERIKAINRVREKHLNKQKSENIQEPNKYQNFLNEITTVEQQIANNGNDEFIRKMVTPNLYEPVTTLWESFNDKGSIETKELFKETVKEYVGHSQQAANKLIDDCDKSIKKQPERKMELFFEHRNWYIERLANIYVPIDSWYHKFWNEQTQSVSDLDALELEIFLFCHRLNKPFMVGVRLLRNLYAYYHAIGRFNHMIQQGSDRHDLPPPKQLANDQKKELRVTLEKCFEYTSKYHKVIALLAEHKYCDSSTHIWIDRGSGHKSMVVELIKHLYIQKFYGKEPMPKNEEIVLIAKNTFGVDLGIDIVKRTKPALNFRFIGPASTF